MLDRKLATAMMYVVYCASHAKSRELEFDMAECQDKRVMSCVQMARAMAVHKGIDVSRFESLWLDSIPAKSMMFLPLELLSNHPADDDFEPIHIEGSDALILMENDFEPIVIEESDDDDPLTLEELVGADHQ